MCADTSSKLYEDTSLKLYEDTSLKLYEDTSLKLYEDTSPNSYEDTSSGIYSTVNEATKNTSSQYAIPAIETTAAQKELKIEVSNGPGCKEIKAYKTRKTSLNKSLDIEVVKQKTEKRRKNRITLLCPVKFAFAIVFIFAMIIVVSMVIALFVQMRNLHEMNRALQKSVERLNHEKNIISEQTKLSHLYDLVLSMDNKIKYFNISLDKSQKLVNDLISAQEIINGEVTTNLNNLVITMDNFNNSLDNTQELIPALEIINREVTTNVSKLYNLVLSMDNRMNHFNISLENSQELIPALEIINREVTTNVSKLYNLVLSMDNRMNHFNISLENSQKVVRDFNSAQENINREVLKRFSSIPHFFSSCSDIARLNSFYASGNYIVKSFAGVLRSVYCDMSRTFGGTSTGWMRVAELDVNNCPPGLRHQTTNTVKTCVVKQDNAGCTEINYPVNNIRYTKITGQIRGYQVKTSDCFERYGSTPRPINFRNLNNNYLDGVSISTNGRHVWSFAAGCNCRNAINKPTIIGQDYTCDGVHPGHSVYDVWASQQCGRNSIWFYKVLPPTTTDIKVRICRDENRSNEDLALKTLELYIQ